MPPARIDLARLRILWRRADVSLEEMAAIWGVSVPAVSQAARRIHLPRRLPGARRAGPARPDAGPVEVTPPPAPPVPDLDPLDRAILENGQTYDGRAKIAAAHGVSETTVLLRFHQLRATI